MSVLGFKPAIPEQDPREHQDRLKEKAFLEHYSWLTRCALGITHGQRDHAEDLVHDVFVQFLAKDTVVASITDIRWYLSGILRNLYLLQLRRATRHPVQQLSLLDYDSAMVGLRVCNSVEQIQSVDLLLRACDFACYRKEAALTSSILILRFFHGYYPGEITALLHAKRKAVDQWIQRGRMETKQYLDAPYVLPVGGRAERKVSSPATSNSFLRHLRRRIFDSCTTACSVLSHNPLELGVKELAHLASCRACLDVRSRKVGLAHVAERMADDISDRDDGRPQSGSGQITDILSLRKRRKPSSRAILGQLHARKRELFEHRPRELSLTFDGQTHATLLVNAPTNTINFFLDAKEVPNSIGILSEQDFLFLILDHADLTCGEPRLYRLQLSDQRFLEVAVAPEVLGISIHLVYVDPLLASETCGAADQRLDAIAIKTDDPILSFPGGRGEFTRAYRQGRWTALLDRFPGLVPALNPLLTSAVLLGLASVLCFVFWLRSSPSLSATELLDYAQKAELGNGAAHRPGVIRQKITIRTQRRSLERTIYRDAQGMRRPRQQKLSPEDRQLRSKLAGVGVSWEAPLSAADYADWRYRSGATRDLVTHPGPHLLKLTTTPLSGGAVLSESLTVRDTDFHPVQRAVDLRDAGTIEVAELNYDVLPWADAASLFAEPASPPLAPTASVSGPILNPLETELEVRSALHGIKADLGEPIEVQAGAQGSPYVSVVGIVSSIERKQELLAVLARMPHVAARLQTEQEAGARALRAPVTRAVPEIVTAQSPIEKELVGYFGDPASVENFSKHTLAVAEDLMAHAWALRHLSERYPPAESQGELTLGPSSRQLLQAMRRDHQRAMGHAASELATSLRPVLQSMVDVPAEAADRLPLFETAREVQRLAMELLSGPASPNAGASEPARAAQDLLAALGSLEATLEEQP